jgi:hypothetical protein
MTQRALEIIQQHIPWLTIQILVIIIAVYLIVEAVASLRYPRNGSEPICVWARVSRIVAGGLLILLVG